MRGLVSQAFTRRRVDRLAPRIEELAAELFTGLESAEGPVDLIEDLASPCRWRSSANCSASPRPIATGC